MTLQQIHELARLHKDYADFEMAIKQKLTNQPSTVEVKGMVGINLHLRLL